MSDRPFLFVDIDATVETLMEVSKLPMLDARRAHFRRIVMGTMDHGVRMGTGANWINEDGKLPPGLLSTLQAQLLIVAIRKLAQKQSKAEVRVGIEEVDDTGRWTLHMEVEQATRKFILRAQRKQ